MMRVTIAFLKGEVAASNHVRKKTLPVWKQQEAERKQNFESRGDSGINKEQSGDRVARQIITQSFSLNPEILFPPLGDKEGTKGPMIIEAEIGGHFIHRIYVDGGSASEILYEHCFNRLRPEDAEDSTSTWMNFVVVRSPSPYNGIIGRPEVRRIQAVPSTAHEMIKFSVPGGILTLRSNRIIPLEYTMVSGPEVQPSSITQAVE
ncbi:hypothetical protein Tco_0686623 [Tanacetum coccineum]